MLTRRTFFDQILGENMSRRGGGLRREMQELVTIYGSRVNQDGSDIHYQKFNQKIIIMPLEKAKIEAKGFVFQDSDYVGLLKPPNFYIHVNDQITRQPRSEDNPRGASNDQIQILTVQDIDILKGRQMLYLNDRGVR